MDTNQIVEDLENKRKRLLFRSEHRGTKEMDLIMGSFARENLRFFSEKELKAFEEILLCNDPDLYDWITGKTTAPANIDGLIFEKIKAHRLA